MTPLAALPSALTSERRWVVAKPETVGGRTTKVPYSANDPARRASSTDPATWSDFETAKAHVASGAFPWLGFMFEGSGLVGIDFDHCITNGDLADWAAELLHSLDAYTEVSVSGTGLHVIARGSLPPGRRRTGKSGAFPPVPADCEVEMYDSGRYFVVTGDRIGAADICERSVQIAALHLRLFGASAEPPVSAFSTAGSSALSDDDLLAKIRTSKQAEKFEALWAGDTDLHNGDDSAADLALCTILSFWTGRDRARIDRLFRRSGLVRPKWDRADYRGQTLDRACAIKDVYEPSALILDPGDPLASAREFVTQFKVDGQRTLQHQNGVFYLFDPDCSAYFEREESTVRAALYGFLEQAKCWADDRLQPFKPTKAKVEGVLDALRAVCNLPAREKTPPCWLRSSDISHLDPLELLACRNGLLHIPTRTLYPATANFFSLNGLDFAYDADAPEPTDWLAFLRGVWPNDQDSIDTLQEVFGYYLTPDTQFQKIVLIVGPTRSGKGTQARVLRQMIGERNVCSPKLSSFGRDFGLQGMIGKSVAIISDARISGRTDTAAVAESLLSVSGEDGQSIPRKFLPDWEGKLNVRFLMLANELPRIGESSGALMGRFVVLVMKESFLGREDLGLLARLKTEMPGILKWALDGRDRLYARRHFVQPKSADATIQEFRDLTSPHTAFLRDHCETGEGHEVLKSDLFRAWQVWCEINGHKYTGTAQSFGRDLRAALPWLTDTLHRVGDDRPAYWVGLQLKVSTPTERVNDLPF